MYFSQKASQFHSNVYIEYDGRRLNGKSLLGILSLGINKGDIITIIGEGKDEQTAVNRLVQLVQSDFAEEE
jgi:phosphotransferase system HPr (HPr) family protein